MSEPPARRVLQMRLVVHTDDHDAAVRHRVPAPIFFRVEADQRTARHQNVAIDDGPPDPGVTADADTGHENCLFNLAKAVHAHVRTQNASNH